MINKAKEELLTALMAMDKSAMSLSDLKLCAEILRTLSEVSDTTAMDVLSENMKAMVETMKDAAAPFAGPSGPVGLGYAI